MPLESSLHLYRALLRQIRQLPRQVLREDTYGTDCRCQMVACSFRMEGEHVAASTNPPSPPFPCRESRAYYRAHLKNHCRSHADESDALRIAQLQERARSDAAWVVKKVSECTVYRYGSEGESVRQCVTSPGCSLSRDGRWTRAEISAWATVNPAAFD